MLSNWYWVLLIFIIGGVVLLVLICSEVVKGFPVAVEYYSNQYWTSAVVYCKAGAVVVVMLLMWGAVYCIIVAVMLLIWGALYCCCCDAFDVRGAVILLLWCCWYEGRCTVVVMLFMWRAVYCCCCCSVQMKHGIVSTNGWWCSSCGWLLRPPIGDNCFLPTNFTSRESGEGGWLSTTELYTTESVNTLKVSKKVIEFFRNFMLVSNF